MEKHSVGVVEASSRQPGYSTVSFSETYQAALFPVIVITGTVYQDGCLAKAGLLLFGMFSRASKMPQ